MSEKKWFTAKGIFLQQSKPDNIKQWYEERIVLLKAKSKKQAMKFAKKEAKVYAKDSEGTKLY